MSKKPSDPKVCANPPPQERRSPPGPTGSLRWLKALLGRPLALQRREGKLHVVLVDRRRPPEEHRARAMDRLRDELRTRLLGQEHEHAAQAMRHLVFVHDELGRRGWTGVELMPAPLLRKALVQAQMLHDQEASNPLARMIAHLHVLLVGAELREERAARLQGEAAGRQLEVSETTHEEFEAMERSWVGTVTPVTPPISKT